MPLPLRFRLVLLLCLVSGSLTAQTVEVPGLTRFHFADLATGREILVRTDDFVSRLSPFDRSARLKTDLPVDASRYLNFVWSHVREWGGDEPERLTDHLNALAPRLAALTLDLPDTVFLVKTSGMEEGQAPYTRANAIVLPEPLFVGTDIDLKKILLHELFHIWSRANPERREALYALIGFHYCGEIDLPEILQPIKLTNPDAPVNAWSISVTHEGDSLEVVPVLYANRPGYDMERGGEFFHYLTFALLAIEQGDSGAVYQSVDGSPRLLGVNAVGGYFEQVGRNTNYIIHPEEILADNFALMVQGVTAVRTPELLTAMRRFFSAGDDR